MAHWHVASGLAGYGPDASDDGYVRANTPVALADVVRDELRQWADIENDGAQAYADAKDFEGAWTLAKHADSIENVRENLNNERANAPLYAGQPDKWDDTILATVGDHFPYAVDENRSYVYVWKCGEPDDVCRDANTDD